MKNMMLDEEAQANQAATVPPPPEPPMPPAAGPVEAPDPELMAEKGPPQQQPQPSAGPRPATPQERKMFDTVLQQALGFLTSSASAEHLIAQSRRTPPEAVVADAVQQTVDGIVQAAEAAGVQIPSAVKGVSIKAATAALAGIMVKAGLAEDAPALARKAMAVIQQSEQPQQAPMEAANGAVG